MSRFYLLPCTVLLAACGGAAETPAPVEAPPAPDIRGEEVSYESGGVTMNGFLAWDAARDDLRPGVLVVHEWWGHNDYVRGRALQLAELGYTALAIDMYGDGKQADHPEDAQKFMMEVVSDMEASAARFVAAEELLQAHPSTDPERTAAIGYCFGGAVVLHMARVGRELDGVASFHGNLGTQSPAQAETFTARVLVAHGADDPFVPAAQVDAFQQEMAAAGVDVKFLAYPGAKHAFTNPGATALGEQFELPLLYDEEADRQSWAELEGFLEEIFATD